MKQKNETVVVVIRNGIAKEVHLPDDIVRVLEEAYDREPVVGISRDSYRAMAGMLGNRVLYYQSILSDKENIEMFSKTTAFAEAFGIDGTYTKLLFDLMCWIERCSANMSYFSSGSINMNTLLGFLNGRSNKYYSYYKINKDFKNWAQPLFGYHQIQMGIVKFCKFFYSVIKDEDWATIA